MVAWYLSGTHSQHRHQRSQVGKRSPGLHAGVAQQVTYARRTKDASRLPCPNSGTLDDETPPVCIVQPPPTRTHTRQ